MALTQLEWARMLLARGVPRDVARGEAMLTSARDTAQHYGFAAVARRAQEELAALI